jgi:two-component system, cell cycle response regulator
MLAEAEENAISPRSQRMADRSRRVLVVDDERVALMFLERQVRDLGYDILLATNGQEALELLRARPADIDVIVLDRELPILDGIALVKRTRQDPALRRIPIIMVTGFDQPEQIREGIDAGVFYYLTKPIDAVLLRSVLNAAFREVEQQQTLRRELRRHRTGFDLIQTCKFRFRRLEEAEDLAVFMANCFPHSERVLPGLAELMINAVEHGNLKIGYQAKSVLLNEGTWRDEIERRLELPENRDKYGEAVIARKNDGIYVVITDQGEGFDWREYMHVDPARANDNHGRGIAQANMLSFDQLKFNATGNQAIGLVRGEPDLDW